MEPVRVELSVLLMLPPGLLLIKANRLPVSVLSFAIDQF